MLAVLAIEQVFDRTATVRVLLLVAGVEASFFGGLFVFNAAGWAAVGKAGLAGLQFKFLTTNDTGFDREGHNG